MMPCPRIHSFFISNCCHWIMVSAEIRWSELFFHEICFGGFWKRSCLCDDDNQDRNRLDSSFDQCRTSSSRAGCVVIKSHLSHLMAEAPVVQWLLWNPSGTSLQFDPFEPREPIECIETLQKWNLLQNSGNSLFHG